MAFKGEDASVVCHTNLFVFFDSKQSKVCFIKTLVVLGFEVMLDGRLDVSKKLKIENLLSQ